MSIRKARNLLAMQKKEEAIQVTKQAQTQPEQVQVRKVKRNAFDAFQHSESDEQQTTTRNEEVPKQKVSINQESKEPVEKESTNKQPRKKNKKKKKESDDQLDKMLQQCKMRSRQEEEEEKEDPTSHDLLELSQNKLKYEKELSKYFKDAKQEAEVEPEGLNKRDKRYLKAMAKLKLKKSIIAPGVKDYFPINDKFEVQTKDKLVYFSPNKKYQVLQQQYESIKNSNDVQQMFDFMQKHPDHIDALYNVGEFLRLKGNYKQADALIQRILYIYQQTSAYQLSLMFKHSSPDIQFAYAQYSSGFFMALFKFIDILGKKGCYRSALQYNKLLLKLNNSDPTACLLCFDYNCCSAKQYQYLIQFVQFYSKQQLRKPNQTIYWMPNFIYSVALAKFLNSTEPKQVKIIEEINIDTHLVFLPQHLTQAMTLKAIDIQKTSHQTLLLRAILLYPRVIKDISDKNEFSKQFVNSPGLQGSQKLPFKDLLLQQIVSNAPDNYFYSFLNLQNQSDSKGMLKLLQIYTVRSKILWKTPSVLLWVKAALGFLKDNLTVSTYFQYVQKLTLKQHNQDVKQLSFNLRRYEHVSQNNFSDRVQRIDLQNIHDNQAGGPIQRQGQTVNLTNNPLRLLFQSLLPWVNLPQTQQDPDMPIIEDQHD